MQEIGKRLAQIRKDTLGLSQKAFAQLLEISQGALSDIENGNRGISSEALIRLYEISISETPFSFDWLITGNNNLTELDSLSLNDDEKELLENYRQLDSRGRHILHATVYQEIDRINKSTQ